jgi:peroxiredoxin
MHPCALVVASTCFALSLSGPPSRPAPVDDPPRVPPSLSPAATEPRATPLAVGDLAPDVTWDGPAGRVQRLRDLRAQGHVLLLFHPDEATLTALEGERDRLLDLRVVPAAVLDRGNGALEPLARRLALHFTLIPDPRHVLATQFDALDPVSGRGVPCWFVLDRWGHVRALGHGDVPAGLARVASSALQLPLPDASQPARAR